MNTYALVTTGTGVGTWEYSLDGTNWSPVGTVSVSAVLLLRADAPTPLRLNPHTKYNGTTHVTFRTWDGRYSSGGTTTNLSTIPPGVSSAVDSSRRRARGV